MQKESKKNVENKKSNGLKGSFPKKLKTRATITKNIRQYKTSLYIVVLFRKLSINFSIGYIFQNYLSWWRCHFYLSYKPQIHLTFQ